MAGRVVSATATAEPTTRFADLRDEELVEALEREGFRTLSRNDVRAGNTIAEAHVVLEIAEPDHLILVVRVTTSEAERHTPRRHRRGRVLLLRRIGPAAAPQGMTLRGGRSDAITRALAEASAEIAGDIARNTGAADMPRLVAASLSPAALDVARRIGLPLDVVLEAGIEALDELDPADRAELLGEVAARRAKDART